ncbi:MAG TPA: hypothetical protein VK421_06075 [Pyrinomonadaceae bacterium]|nr:hypothetical protein [Pyrinomonadaceae bacterium]
MPKDPREVTRGVRVPAVRNEQGRITGRPRTLTDEDEVSKLPKAQRDRLAERGAITGFGVAPYGAKGREGEFEAAGEAHEEANNSATKKAAKKAEVKG